MKKVILLLICALLLSGCGKAEPVVCCDHFAVMREDTEIALDAPAQPILEVLGVPFGYAESSGQSGIERTYRFPGMNLKTYSGEDGERVLGICIDGGTMQTPEGIAIGASARQVQECYGLDALPSGCCTVRRSSETMTLTIKNSVVTQIQYSLM